MNNFTLTAYLVMTPIYATLAAVPEVVTQESVLGVSAAGATLSGLLSLRRSLQAKEETRMGALNMMIAVVAGVLFGYFFANELVEATIFGFENPLGLRATAFFLSLSAAQILDLVADGTIKRFILKKLNLGAEND